jgi:predicted Zn-dependent peptidase
MMFKGSENVAEGEHFKLIATNGGESNGNTDRDRTVYFERLPTNQLGLALFLEADRMRLPSCRRISTTSGQRCMKSGGSGSTTSRMRRSFEALFELA